jgi:hypothetical protein
MGVVEDGQLKGAFRGFKDRETRFTFTNGRTWRQKAYQYHYHYAYAPEAKVVDRDGGYYLEVDGMDDSVEVVRD